MKKIVLPLAAALVLFASCKKDYTCSCTSIFTQQFQGGSPTISSSSSTTTFKNVTKKFVTDEWECYSDEYSYSDGLGSPTTFTVDKTCTLSK